MPPSALPASEDVRVVVAASPEVLWEIVSDPAMPARYSRELIGARIADGSRPGVGALIEGRNERDGFTWTTTSTVVEFDPPRIFRWVVGGDSAPVATWSFEIEPDARGALLRHSVVLHAHHGPVARAVHAEPDHGHQIVADRLAELVANMNLTVEGAAREAEDSASLR